MVQSLYTLTQPCPPPSLALSLSLSLSLSLPSFLPPFPSLPLPPSLSPRMLVPQADGYSRESVHEFLTQIAQENLLQSWRETMLMVHKQPTKLPTQRQVTSVSKNYVYTCSRII